MLVAAVDELLAADVIGNFLCLVRGLYPIVITLNENKYVLFPDLGRVMLGQVLRHGVPPSGCLLLARI